MSGCTREQETRLEDTQRSRAEVGCDTDHWRLPTSVLRQAEQNFCGVEAQWDLGLDSHLIDAQLGFLSDGRPHSRLMKAQLGFFCEPLRDKPKIPKILRNYISAEVGREAAVRKEAKKKNKRGVRNA